MRDTKQKTSRWQYRLDNYKRAFSLLREGMELLAEKKHLTQLEKEGLIQRFAYTMELAWKVMADYLEAENVVLQPKTPREVIRKAFEANIIADGETWMNALDARNTMAHVYDFEAFQSVILSIQNEYLQLMDDLHLFLLEKTAQEQPQ